MTEPKTSSSLSVKSTWLDPVAFRFARIETMLSRENPNLDGIQALIDEIPSCFAYMDHKSLADAFEAALGAATLTGAMDSKAAEILAGLSADEYEATVGFGPFESSAAGLDKKTPIGSRLNSRQWQGVPAELRDRAMFSAKVESVRFLSEARDRLSAQMRLQREQLTNGKQALFDRDSFISSMREIASDEGIDTNNGEYDHSIKDIRSAKRLGLIYDVQTQLAEEYGRYKMSMDPDVLDAYPAKRLIRVEDRDRKREWKEIWGAASNEVGGEGVAKGGDMVALVTSPIWTHLGPFENPYPPFDWGSGMGTEDVSRAEAEDIGLITATEEIPVPEETERFNSNLFAGLEGVSQDLRDELAKSFDGQVEITGDVAKWLGDA
jgi:hypothetical protein